jgi:hypothetical protein
VGSIKQWLGRLQRRLPEPDQYDDPAVKEALRQLTDAELELLGDALDRGLDPQKERQDVLVSPAQRALSRGSVSFTRI